MSQTPNSPPESELIYKKCPAELWRQAEAAGQFTGAGIDIADGYIHFSSASQLVQTARLHFAGQEGLMLVAVDLAKIDVVWETSRGGQLFPHLYNSLPMAAVAWVVDFTQNAEGEHVFPAGILMPQN